MATQKERIVPPSRKNTKEAAKALPKGGPAADLGGRAMSERKAAKQQGVKRGGK